MSRYTRAVKRNLKGLEGISVGICPGCSECAESLGYHDSEDDDGNVIESALDKLAADWESGRACDEGSFSRESCGICGSHLGGNRYSWHYILNGRLQHADDACEDCLIYIANGDEPTDWEGR